LFVSAVLFTNSSRFILAIGFGSITGSGVVALYLLLEDVVDVLVASFSFLLHVLMKFYFQLISVSQSLILLAL
jgi:hypothetical protein